MHVLLFCLLTFLPALADNDRIHIGFMDNEAPVSYSTFHDTLSGIGFDLTQMIHDQIQVEYDKHVYSDADIAVSDLNQGKIQLLVGPFSTEVTKKYENVAVTHPYFIDELAVIVPKHNLYLSSLNTILWNGLLESTLLFSLILACVFTGLLYFFEANVHPHMLKSSTPEKISYCFFTIFACFCRDLLYDPVTTSGRLLVSIWMVISVVLITIITSIVTSSIIFLHQNGPDSMRDISELSQKKVGFVAGDYTTRTILDELSIQAEPMQDPNALLQAIATDRLQYVVLPKSQYEFQIKKDRNLRNLTTLTSTNIAYKPWTFAVNKDYAQTMLSDKTYIDTLDHIIDTNVHSLGIYTICKRYLSAPSHCVF